MDAIRLNQEFDSFEELHKAIQSLSKATNEVFSRRNSRSVKNANKLIKNSLLWYPLHFKYTYAKYVCKHFGDPRRRGKGIRPNQKSSKTGCTAYIVVSVDRQTDKLVVIACNLEHIHETSEAVYHKYKKETVGQWDADKTPSKATSSAPTEQSPEIEITNPNIYVADLETEDQTINRSWNVKKERRKSGTEIEEQHSTLFRSHSDISEHEFDIFGKSVAAQLKKLPLEKALTLQLQMQNIITHERINLLRGIDN